MPNLATAIYRQFFKLFCLPVVNWNYIHHPAIFTSIASADPTKLFIVSIAYNDVRLIDLQNQSLKKYLCDAYEYFVVDNSDKEDQSEKIKQYCLANRISYVRLPKNPGFDGSLSNAFALNWAFQNLIKKMQPKNFGFIDHDIFLIRQTSFVDHLKKEGFWGLRGGGDLNQILFLWGGFCFFQYSFLKAKNGSLNFLPAITWKGKFDTGAGNRNLFRGERENHLVFMKDIHWENLSARAPSQFFDDVVHIAGGGNRASLSEDIIDEKLKAYEARFGRS